MLHALSGLLALVEHSVDRMEQLRFKSQQARSQMSAAPTRPPIRAIPRSYLDKVELE